MNTKTHSPNGLNKPLNDFSCLVENAYANKVKTGIAIPAGPFVIKANPILNINK